MIKSKRILMLAFLIPIAVLLALTMYKKSVISYGTEIIFPIEGYDPRDLLSGHYLIYRVDYGIPEICQGSTGGETAYLCFENKTFSFQPISGCTKQIRGICNRTRFEAGIEKYYVPETEALALETQVRAKKASIVVSIGPGGIPQVKDLLLDGQPWKKIALEK